MHNYFDYLDNLQRFQHWWSTLGRGTPRLSLSNLYLTKPRKAISTLAAPIHSWTLAIFVISSLRRPTLRETVDHRDRPLGYVPFIFVFLRKLYCLCWID